MATNTLGEFSDGEDNFVMEIDENLWEWSNSEDDDLIRNINEDEVLVGLYGNDDDDELIRNINEEQVLDGLYDNDYDENEMLTEDTQTGRGEKRKSDEQSLPPESGEYYYNIETVKKHHSKKFGMTATDHKVRFNNVLGEFDLLESHERTQAIFITC